MAITRDYFRLCMVLYVCVCILLCQLLLKSVLIRKIRNAQYCSSVDRISESKMNESKAKRDKELFLLRCISFLLLLNCLMGCFRLFSFVCVYQGLGTLTNSMYMYSVHCTLHIVLLEKRKKKKIKHILCDDNEFYMNYINIGKILITPR